MCGRKMPAVLIEAQSCILSEPNWSQFCPDHFFDHLSFSSSGYLYFMVTWVNICNDDDDEIKLDSLGVIYAVTWMAGQYILFDHILTHYVKSVKTSYVFRYYKFKMRSKKSGLAFKEIDSLGKLFGFNSQSVTLFFYDDVY